MSLDKISSQMIPAVEQEIEASLVKIKNAGFNELHHMLAYHLGFEGQGAGKKARGKRVRPLLVMLSTAAAGGQWENALPAAAAVELVHNFSLIHDDIQDDSPIRRGRETVWKIWGISKGINAGDSMFALAHVALERLSDLVPAEIAIQAHKILPKACLDLTQGQFLDLAYENRDDLSVEDYWPMIKGKTASLLATSTELGALIAGSDIQIRKAYRDFGEYVGLAFQIQDDILGIWGDAALTGKSAESDLVSGKKSLPILYALGKTGKFADRWAAGPISPEEVSDLSEILKSEGALEYARKSADELTQKALSAFQQTNSQGQYATVLRELAELLIRRKA